MKSVTVVLLMCAALLGWIAPEALANTGNPCATTVPFNAQNHTSSISCPTDACTASCPPLKQGVCDGATALVSQHPVWKHDSSQNKWVLDSSLVFSGQVEMCFCKVECGTEEKPNPRWISSPCCTVARIPSLDGSVVHRVALLGQCDIPGCSSGSCAAHGTNVLVAAICED